MQVLFVGVLAVMDTAGAVPAVIDPVNEWFPDPLPRLRDTQLEPETEPFTVTDDATFPVVDMHGPELEERLPVTVTTP